MILRLAGVLLALVLWCSTVLAQTDSPDFDAWSNTAQRAERAIENAQASDQALSTLRAELDGWRQEFSLARSANSTRLTTLNDQLAALGDAPADGATEPAVISERRASLLAEIDRLGTPRLAAIEAFARADGLVGEIDGILDSRQTNALFARGESPLNPASWLPAVGAFTNTIQGLVTGVTGAINSPAQREQAIDRLPFVVLMVVLAGLLILRSKPVLMALARPVLQRETAASGGLARFLVTTGALALNLVGVYFLIMALQTLEFYGPRGAKLLDAMPAAAVIVFVGFWLADAARNVAWRTKRLVAAVRWGAGILGVRILLAPVFAVDGYSARIFGVLDFVFIVLAALALFVVGQAFRRKKLTPAEDSADGPGLSVALRQYAGYGAMLVAVVSPALAAFGYGEAAARMVFPMALSLGGLATLSLIFEAVRDALSWVGGPNSRARDGLWPIFINMCIGLAALPAFALVWGVRQSSLAELWATVRTGVQVGGTTISPTALFTLVIVFVIGVLLTRLLQRALSVNVLPRTQMDVGGRTAIVSGLGYLGIFLAGIIAITSAGIDLSSLAIVAGALSVGIGFGLQNIVSNFVSGIILLIERPISEGDWIEVGGHMGYVRDISVRSTRIETFDKTDVIVPNADFVSGTVTNYTRGNTTGRIIVPVGVAYGTDTRKVQDMLLEIAQAHPMVLLNPGPSVVFQGFGADSLEFEIRAILRDVTWGLTVKTEMNHQINEAFTKHGIEIPYAQRDIWIRNPDALPGLTPSENS